MYQGDELRWTDRGISDDNSFMPSQVLREERELRSTHILSTIYINLQTVSLSDEEYGHTTCHTSECNIHSMRAREPYQTGHESIRPSQEINQYTDKSQKKTIQLTYVPSSLSQISYLINTRAIITIEQKKKLEKAACTPSITKSIIFAAWVKILRFVHD
jgi:hypothetical protein